MRSLRIFRSAPAALTWARFQPRGSGRLYLIECRELVKIGMTQDAYARFNVQLNSFPLLRCNFRSVSFSPVVDNHEDLERKLHKLLYRFRVRKDRGGFLYEHYEIPQILVRALRRYLSRVGEAQPGEFVAFCSLREIIENQIKPASPIITFPRRPRLSKFTTTRKRRLTIRTSRDATRHSTKVRDRMTERRSRNYSHYVETLIAEDAGLVPKLQEVVL